MIVVGIDPSLTRTSVCIGGSVFQATSKPPGEKTVASRIGRYQELARRVLSIIHEAGPELRETAIFVEDYAFSRNDANARYCAEYGGILRLHLLQMTSKVYDVPLTTMKKFVTGSGKATKEAVAGHITSRWKVVFDNSDDYDAFGLYQIGLCATGLQDATNQAQREAVATVLSRTLRKKGK